MYIYIYLPWWSTKQNLNNMDDSDPIDAVRWFQASSILVIGPRLSHDSDNPGQALHHRFSKIWIKGPLGTRELHQHQLIMTHNY